MPRRATELPAACEHVLARADAIVHAGDLSTPWVLELLEAFRVPVIAVAGNVEDDDVRRRLPAERVLDVGGMRIAVVHDAGPERGRRGRMARRFPDADGVVFGHSHIPLWAAAPPGPWLVNPGSPTDPRRQPHPSMAELVVGRGGVRVHHLAVDGPEPRVLATELVRGAETARPARD
jgi:putative phosphoesterase